MSDAFEDFGDYDDDVGLTQDDKKHAKQDREEWWKGEKGNTYRGALVYFHSVSVNAVVALRKKSKKENTPVTKEQVSSIAQQALAKQAEKLGKAVDQLTEIEKLDLTAVKFKKVLAHYKEGIGYVASRLGLDGADADEVWKMMGDQKKYFTTALLLYPTTKEGDLVKENLASGWKVVPWRIGPKVYTRCLQVAEGLRANDLTIADQDLTLKCTNAEFQNFDIDGAGKAVWRKNDKFQAKVLEVAHKLFSGKGLLPFREMSTADLRIKLGGAGGASSGGTVSEDEFDGLLDNV